MQTSTISSTIETIESNESNQIVESTNSTESKESFYECCICMVDDKKIYNIYKCPECKNIYCYNCLRTYIYDYSNLTPHCPQCDTVIPFIEVFNSLILIYPKDSNIPVCHIIHEYVEKAADVKFHLELQRMPEIVDVVPVLQKICKFQDYENYEILKHIFSTYFSYRIGTNRDIDSFVFEKLAEQTLYLLTQIINKPKTDNFILSLDNDILKVSRVVQSIFRELSVSQAKKLLTKIVNTLGLNEYINLPIKSLVDFFNSFGDLKSVIRTNYQRYSNKKLGAPEKVKYVFKCSNGECEGKVDISYTCTLCRSKYCSKCWKMLKDDEYLETKGNEDSDDEDNTDNVANQTNQSNVANQTNQSNVANQTNQSNVDKSNQNNTNESNQTNQTDLSNENQINESNQTDLNNQTNTSNHLKPHQCNEADVASVKNIKSTTKPCPHCSTRIHKYVGCSQMFCTHCHSSFDYNTGKIITGNFHNPHRLEWLAANGLTGNEPNIDGGCNLTAHFYNDIMQWYIAQRNDRRDALRYGRNDMVKPYNNQQLYEYLCLYACGELSKKSYKLKLQYNELLRIRFEMIESIYNEYDDNITAIFNDMTVNINKAYDKLVKYAITTDAKCRSIINILTTYPTLFNYIKEFLVDVSRDIFIKEFCDYIKLLNIELDTNEYRYGRYDRNANNQNNEDKVNKEFANIIYNNLKYIIGVVPDCTYYFELIKNLIDHTNDRLKMYMNMFDLDHISLLNSINFGTFNKNQIHTVNYSYTYNYKP